MDVIEITRQLGKALQQDEKYLAYAAAKKASDDDQALQDAIGAFNLIRIQLNEEMNKEGEQNKDKITDLNQQLRKSYAEIMANENMQAYNNAKNELDHIVQRVNGIIELCLSGEDPDTCEPSGCTGSCSTCGGCH